MADKSTVINTVRTLLKGGTKKEDIMQVVGLMIKNINSGFPKDEVLDEVILEINRFNKEGVSLAQEVRDYITSTSGIFSRTDCLQELHLSTRKDKKNLSTILKRLCKDGLIESYGTKNGVFRKLDETESRIDFMAASEEKMELNIPFSLQDYVDIYPKNIIVIAGAPDAGKTAFLLNLAEMNMDKHNVFYFSSEMGEQELRLRLSKFKRPMMDFGKVNWIERSSEFQDVIRPNDINIIDFLEIHEDFWKIGLMIKNIFDKLDKGVAFIALQKDKHKEHGLGGSRGLEKARLYLTMNPGEMTIVKAKNWANPMFNPNNKIFDYKLVQGHEFHYKGMRQ